ncbi:hypothetical protein Gpo141_00005565 [Globisporangium polare]
MAVVIRNALLAAALSLFLTLLGFVLVKYVRYQRRERDGNSSDDSDNDDENASSEVVGVDNNGEKIALINQEHRRMQRAESSSSTAGGSLFRRLLALLSLPGAVVETKLLPKRYQRRHNRNRTKPAAPKKFHKPYFYPLLQETAQWWEAQCELQAIKVDDLAVLSSSSIAKRVGVAPEEPHKAEQSDLLYAADATVLAS